MRTIAYSPPIWNSRAWLTKPTTYAEAGSLDDVSERPWGPEPTRVSLRWILVHLIEEYARHLGHLDLLREAIDGATGD